MYDFIIKYTYYDRDAYPVEVIMDNDRVICRLQPNETSETFTARDKKEHYLYCQTKVFNTVYRSDLVMIPACKKEGLEKITYEFTIHCRDKRGSDKVGKTVDKITKFLDWGGNWNKLDDKVTQQNLELQMFQNPLNEETTRRKEELNSDFADCREVMIALANKILEDPYTIPDFKAYDRLLSSQKTCDYMSQYFIPSLAHACYLSLSRGYFDDRISIRSMYAILGQYFYIQGFKPAVESSCKNAVYLSTDKNDVISIFSEDVVEELQELKNSQMVLESYPFEEYKQMEPLLDETVKNDNMMDYFDITQTPSKKIYDFLVSAGKEEDYFTNLKKSLVYAALHEQDNAECSARYAELKMANKIVFKPLIYDADRSKFLECYTVDMLIADAIHFSQVKTIHEIDKALTTFLEHLCPVYKFDEKQYNILQKVFNYLNAFSQEKMVLESMVKNNIPRSKEQDDRLSFLAKNASNYTSELPLHSNSGMSFGVDTPQMSSDTYLYDYKFMTMSDSEISVFFNELSMNNKTTIVPIVIEEWTKNIEGISIEWDTKEVSTLLKTMLDNSFGDRYAVSELESGLYTMGWNEKSPSILITDESPTGYPWIAYLVTGEQLMQNQLTFAIYNLYVPDSDSLSGNIYEKNEFLHNRVLLLKKKQNPKLNNIMQIVKRSIVKELEEWINSKQQGGIYD